MKILAIVDVHKSANALDITRKYIQEHKPELLIIGGDITTFGPLDFAVDFLSGLPELKTLALPGNCDPKEIITIIIKSKATSLHGRVEQIDGISFIGLGGSNPTPFNTPFELGEEKIYRILDSIMVPGEILVLHFPSKGHLDLVPRGENTGSVSVKKIIDKYKPALVISGHIHETRGIETDDLGTVYVNPGPIKDGFAALIDISTGKERKYNVQVKLLP